MSKLSRNLRKKLSAGLAVIMAVSLAIPAGVSFSSQTVKAEGLTSETKDGDAFYDFRDGSVVPTDTDGKSDITYGNLTIKVGTKNAFNYHGSSHGTLFKDGNSFEIKVNGPTKITLGGCQYSQSGSITASSADGSYTETKEAKTKDCYHNASNYTNEDDYSVSFNYTGETATTITVSFTGQTYVPCLSVKSLKKFYDFRDGSIVPTDTDGKKDISYGGLTIKVGTKNAFKYNDAAHGVRFNDGNALEIAVSGPTKITLGGCQYSATGTITATSADGSYSETKDAKTKDCYHNASKYTNEDDYSISFSYNGDAATIITLAFSNQTYVPCLNVTAITEDIADNNGAVKDSVAVYNFSDGSVLPTTIDSVNPLNGSITSKDNMLTVTGAGDLYVHDAQHGLALYGGNTFEIKVAGDATVTFNMCQYGGDSTAKIVASSKKGKFTSPKEHLLMDSKADGLSSMSFRYEGVATTLTFTVVAEKEMYLHGINVSNDPEKTETPALVGNGKADVWDFGAAQLDSTKYNNMLTADIINSWYSSDVTPGSSGVTLGSFATDEFFFNPAGKTNNRIRTSNTAITRYDAGKTAVIDDTEFTGYVYSNNTTPTVVVGIKLYKNDILTLYTGSNGGASTIVCESPSGQIQSGESNVDGTKLQFAASEYGVYKIYSTNEKLVVYRAIREHTQPITVNGTLDTTNAAGLDSKDYSIVFTNNLTGEKTVVTPTAGNYSTYLNEMYDYSVSLENANGYVISSANKFSPAKGTGDQKFDITVKAVDLAVVTGKIKGLTENELTNLKLSFSNKNYVYVPEFTVSGDNIVIKVEKGVTYDIIAEGINDYYLSDIKTLTASQDITQDITFAAKPTYKVSLSFDGLPSDAAPYVVFSNINEEGYVYTFTDLSNIKLRNGQYSVNVNNIGNVAYQQKLTSDLKVNGADVSKTVNFKQVSSWDFSSFNGNPGIETIGENNYYSGLALSGTVLENKIYLLEGADGEIKIPVKKNQIVTLSYCYCASFSINDGDVIASKSGSTDKIESTQYVATEDGTVTVKGASSTVDGASVTQTYFTSITVTDIVEYRAQLFVGNDKEFKTINAALDNVRAMNRTKDERVEIVIDPGNYEEMLVIDMPAVSLVNAAGSDSSLEITNKGVDIGENVVRVTSYYGHGYNYYKILSNNSNIDIVNSPDYDILQKKYYIISDINIAYIGKGTPENNDWSNIHNIIENISNEMSDENTNILLYDINRFNIFAIINSDIHNNLEDIFYKILDSINIQKNNNDYAITIGVDKVRINISEISDACHNCSLALNYILTGGRNAVYYYSPEDFSSDESYYFPSDSINKLPIFIKENRKNKISDYLNDIMNTNITKHSDNLKVMSMLIDELHVTVAKSVKNVFSEHPVNFKLEKIKFTATIEEIFSYYEDVLNTACDEYKIFKEKSNDISNDDSAIIDEINNNITNSELSLAYLTEKFGKTNE